MFDSKLKEELAEAKSQYAKANELAASNYNAVLFYQRRVKELETQFQSAEKAKGDAEFALRHARTQIASLEAGVTQLTDESPFIRVGQTLYLFSSIQTIVADEGGNVDEINGRNCGLETQLSVTALAGMIAARYNRRQGTR